MLMSAAPQDAVNGYCAICIKDRGDEFGEVLQQVRANISILLTGIVEGYAIAATRRGKGAGQINAETGVVMNRVVANSYAARCSLNTVIAINQNACAIAG